MPIYKEVLQLFLNQQHKGLEKYGELLTLEHHDIISFINHAQEECMDKLVYLQGLKEKIKQTMGDKEHVDQV